MPISTRCQFRNAKFIMKTTLALWWVITYLNHHHLQRRSHLQKALKVKVKRSGHASKRPMISGIPRIPARLLLVLHQVQYRVVFNPQSTHHILILQRANSSHPSRVMQRSWSWKCQTSCIMLWPSRAYKPWNVGRMLGLRVNSSASLVMTSSYKHCRQIS